jgi:hypothetical protein
MIITIYRSDCYLIHLSDGWIAAAWSEWRFHPISGGERLTEGGYRKVRDQPLVEWVKLPPLATLADGRRPSRGGLSPLMSCSQYRMQ